MEKHQFSNLLFLEDDQFVMKCLKDSDLLYQLRVCLSFSEDGIFPTQCQKVQKESNMKLGENCPREAKLVGYGEKKEDNVGGRVFIHIQHLVDPSTDQSVLDGPASDINFKALYEGTADL